VWPNDTHAHSNQAPAPVTPLHHPGRPWFTEHKCKRGKECITEHRFRRQWCSAEQQLRCLEDGGAPKGAAGRPEAAAPVGAAAAMPRGGVLGGREAEWPEGLKLKLTLS
jgi:hypothetical protein